MDNTYNPLHVSDNFENIIVIKRSRLPFKKSRIRVITPSDENHFFLTKAFKKIADKKVKKFASKTAAKSVLSQEQQKQFVANVSKAAQPVTTKAARSAALVASGAALTAGGFALAPLFGGAAAAGAGGSAVAAKTAGGITAASVAAKKSGIVDRIKQDVGASVTKFKDTKSGKAVSEIVQSLPESVKQNIAAKGEGILRDIVGDKTAAELLPKTKAQKQLEASIRPSGVKQLPLIHSTELIVIVLIVLFVIGMIVKSRS